MPQEQWRRRLRAIERRRVDGGPALAATCESTCNSEDMTGDPDVVCECGCPCFPAPTDGAAACALAGSRPCFVCACCCACGTSVVFVHAAVHSVRVHRQGSTPRRAARLSCLALSKLCISSMSQGVLPHWSVLDLFAPLFQRLPTPSTFLRLDGFKRARQDCIRLPTACCPPAHPTSDVLTAERARWHCASWRLRCVLQPQACRG